MAYGYIDQSLLPLSHSLLLLCVHPLCPHVPLLFLIKTPFIELRGHFATIWLHLNLVTSTNTLFLSEVKFTGTRVKTRICLLKGHNLMNHKYCARNLPLIPNLQSTLLCSSLSHWPIWAISTDSCDLWLPGGFSEWESPGGFGGTEKSGHKSWSPSKDHGLPPRSPSSKQNIRLRNWFSLHVKTVLPFEAFQIISFTLRFYHQLFLQSVIKQLTRKI